MFCRPDYFLPWQNHPKRESTGTGFVIRDRLLLTNAHVVADQTYVTVKRHGSGTKYRAGAARAVCFGVCMHALFAFAHACCDEWHAEQAAAMSGVPPTTAAAATPPALTNRSLCAAAAAANISAVDSVILADVVGVGHDVDLALLTVEDEAFWEGSEEGGPMKPLQLGDVPQLQVRAYTNCICWSLLLTMCSWGGWQRGGWAHEAAAAARRAAAAGA